MLSKTVYYGGLEFENVLFSILFGTTLAFKESNDLNFKIQES